MRRYFLLVAFVFVLTTACTASAPQKVASQVAVSADQQEDEHGDGVDDDYVSEDHDDHDQDLVGSSREHGPHVHGPHVHGPHVHGVAELMVAWSGNELAIDLRTPAYNVVGFEYKPITRGEIALVEESVAILETGRIIQLSAEANCQLVSSSVETEMLIDDHNHEENHADEEGHDLDEVHENVGAVHSEIDVSYNIQCQNPDNLESIDVSALFTWFPKFEDLRVQWVSDVTQSAQALTADDPILTLR